MHRSLREIAPIGRNAKGEIRRGANFLGGVDETRNISISRFDSLSSIALVICKFSLLDILKAKDTYIPTISWELSVFPHFDINVLFVHLEIFVVFILTEAGPLAVLSMLEY